MGAGQPDRYRLGDDYYTNLDVELVGSIPNLNATGRTEFARAFLDWQRGELETAGYADGLPQLIRAIEPTFGQVRAETHRRDGNDTDTL